MTHPYDSITKYDDCTADSSVFLGEGVEPTLSDWHSSPPIPTSNGQPKVQETWEENSHCNRYQELSTFESENSTMLCYVEVLTIPHWINVA